MLLYTGLRRVVSAIQRLFNSASFYAPLTHTLVLERGTGSPTFTRATTGTFTDHEGVLRTAIAGEARFTGARRVRNLLTFTEDFSNAAWTPGAATVSANTAAAPTGVTNGDTLTEDTANANHRIFRQVAIAANTPLSVSYYMKRSSGTRNAFLILQVGGDLCYARINLGTGAVIQSGAAGGGTLISAAASLDASTGWIRVQLNGTINAANPFIQVYLSNTDLAAGSTPDSYLGDGTSGVYLWGAQLEDVTGQSVQTAAEYVSVGGVPTPVANNYLRLPGVAGNYASTPDSIAASITGDIDIRVQVALDDWTPSAEQALLSKYNGAARSYVLAIAAGSTGRPILYWNNGSSDISITATAAPIVSDGAALWVRATLAVADRVVTFYTSSDGASWSQLGSASAPGAVTTINDSTAIVEAMSYNAGTAGLATGKIYRAQIYNGIGGSLAVDFDPTRYTGSYNGATMTAATGEVWTLNSTAPATLTGARITSDANYAFGYPDHTGGAGVDGVAYFDTDLSGNPIAASTLKGYLAEGARTNLVWPSEDLTSVRYVSGGGGVAVVADQAVAPDGTTTADQLTASGANGTLIQDLGVIASTAQCFSVYLKRKTGTGNIDITLDGGATWTTQTINSTTWTRCEITQTLANPDVGIRIVTSGDAIYAWGLQCE